MKKLLNRLLQKKKIHPFYCASRGGHTLKTGPKNVIGWRHLHCIYKHSESTGPNIAWVEAAGYVCHFPLYLNASAYIQLCKSFCMLRLRNLFINPMMFLCIIMNAQSFSQSEINSTSYIHNENQVISVSRPIKPDSPLIPLP